MFIEKDVADLNNQILCYYKLLEEVFSFKKELSPGLLKQCRGFAIDKKTLFIAKLQNYLHIHLVPELKRQLSKSAASSQQFMLIFKELYKMLSYFYGFVQLVIQDKREAEEARVAISDTIIEEVLEPLQLLDARHLMLLAFWNDYTKNVDKALELKLQSRPEHALNSSITYLKTCIRSQQTSPFNFDTAVTVKNFCEALSVTTENLEHLALDFLIEMALGFIDSLFLSPEANSHNIAKLADMFCKTFVIGFFEWFANEIKLPLKTRADGLKTLKETFDRLLTDRLADNLFEYIKDFKRYRKLLDDFNKLIGGNEDLSMLTTPLARAINTNLLKLSVSTKDIIHFYINLLRFWNSINKHYQILQQLTSSIKSYFLSRQDALRCILDIWIAEVREKSRRASQRKEEPFLINVPLPEVGEDSEDEPSDIDFLVEEERKNSEKLKFRRSDIKTLLIDLYGSRERFLLEYENFVAEKLLKFEITNINEEFENLNFLKAQTKNANAISRCDVLMNDIKYSTKMTEQFRQIRPEALNCEYMILSKSFWPVNYDSQPFDIAEWAHTNHADAFNEFHLAFTKNKRIDFHHNLGEVELDVEVNGKTIEVKCQPINAILLLEVQQSGQFGVSIAELAERLHADANYLKQKMQFWVHKKIVKIAKIEETVNSKSLANLADFEVKQNLVMANSGDSAIYMLNDDFVPTEDIMVNKEDINEQILTSRAPADDDDGNVAHSKIEGYVLNILKISGAKPVSKMFDLLKNIYKNDIPRLYDAKSLQKTVDKLVKKKLLQQKGQMYYIVQ